MRPAVLALMLLTTTACANPRAQLERIPDAEISDAGQVEGLLLVDGLLMDWMAEDAPADPNEDHRKGEQGQCPAPLKLGATTMWLGDCVDARNHEWHGAKLIRRRPGKLGVRYREFPVLSRDDAALGRVRIWKDGDDTRFSIALRISEDQDTFVLDYEGHTTADLLAPDYDPDRPSEWSGLGTLASTEHGKVEILNFAKRYDDSICASEPLSGITQLRASGRTILIRYDGEIACDPKGRAAWSLDGVDMGELDPLPTLCSVDPETPAWPGVLAIAFMLAGTIRRRARTDRQRCDRAARGSRTGSRGL